MHQLTGVMPDRTRKVLGTSKNIPLNLLEQQSQPAHSTRGLSVA